ncbi:cytidine/deoxycytidylate deaminase family protein [Paenibacillus xylanivorans]|uniref:hypothetical protein n=1 Tax=Paenibacillus xylanivorans TaxID=1705561 RepID=UPI001187660E|nr:hypothetical protein [Paenibacillus xylanivorans]
MMTITTEDLELIEAAKNVISRLYQEGKHHVGAAVRTRSGKIFTAVHLEAYIGRVSVCAEAIAIGKAISEGEHEFETGRTHRSSCREKRVILKQRLGSYYHKSIQEHNKER